MGAIDIATPSILYCLVSLNLLGASAPFNGSHGLLCACSIMYGEQARFFDDEIHPNIKHSKKGLVAMAGTSPHLTQAAPQRGGLQIPHVCPCTEGSIGNRIEGLTRLHLLQVLVRI